MLWEVDTGNRVYGSDYYQNMILWSVPAAMAGQDLLGPCKPDGLVSRILEAANPKWNGFCGPFDTTDNEENRDAQDMQDSCGDAER